MGWESSIIKYLDYKYTVSILVSYWMGWEYYNMKETRPIDLSFNPSFLLDGLGIDDMGRWARTAV